jgi:hypothetical protein
MNEPLLGSLLGFLFWWAVVFSMYCAVIFTLDWLIMAWHRRREERRALQARLDQVDAEMRSSVHRLSVEFTVAQHELRRATGREVTRR